MSTRLSPSATNSVFGGSRLRHALLRRRRVLPVLSEVAAYPILRNKHLGRWRRRSMRQTERHRNVTFRYDRLFQQPGGFSITLGRKNGGRSVADHRFGDLLWNHDDVSTEALGNALIDNSHRRHLAAFGWLRLMWPPRFRSVYTIHHLLSRLRGPLAKPAGTTGVPASAIAPIPGKVTASRCRVAAQSGGR